MKWLLRGAIVLHLSIALSGIWPWLGKSPMGPFLNLYARLTGAGSSFGFFSPNVANQLTVSFVVENKAGEKKRLKIDDMVAPDTAIRVGNMFRFFTQMYRYPKIRRSVAASLSAYVFNRYPDAESVQFDAEMFQLAGLIHYRKDPQVLKTPVYRVTFRRAE